jgi:hypothetical protein
MTTLHSTARETPASPASASAPPPAARVGPAGWRDPRLVLGVVIVAVCVLAGARVLASADDTTAVWAARHDLSRGAPIEQGDLAVARVHLTGSAAGRYLPASARLAVGTTASHDVAAGELLARSAITSGSHVDLVEVPLSLAPDDLPASVRQGARVDVWVTPKAGTSDGPARARLALEDVVVVAVPSTEDSLAPRTTQQVIVGVEEARSGDLAQALGLLSDGRVVLTRRAGS